MEILIDDTLLSSAKVRIIDPCDINISTRSGAFVVSNGINRGLRGAVFCNLERSSAFDQLNSIVIIDGQV